MNVIAMQMLKMQIMLANTNVGKNLYDWILLNAKPLVLTAIVVIGVYLAFKREITKLIGFGVVALLSVVLVYNTSGIQKFMLAIGNKFLGL